MANPITHVETNSEIAISQNQKTILRGKMSHLLIKDYSNKLSTWLMVKNIFLIPFMFILLLFVVYPNYASELYLLMLFILSVPLSICIYKVIFFYMKRRLHLKANYYRDERNAQLDQEFWDLNS